MILESVNIFRLLERTRSIHAKADDLTMIRCPNLRDFSTGSYPTWTRNGVSTILYAKWKTRMFCLRIATYSMIIPVWIWLLVEWMKDFGRSDDDLSEGKYLFTTFWYCCTCMSYQVCTYIWACALENSKCWWPDHDQNVKICGILGF